MIYSYLDVIEVVGGGFGVRCTTCNDNGAVISREWLQGTFTTEDEAETYACRLDESATKREP